MRLPLGEFSWEWMIVRRDPSPPPLGQHLGPYRNEVDVRRDFEQWRGAALYRRRVWRARNYRLVEAKERDVT